MKQFDGKKLGREIRLKRVIELNWDLRETAQHIGLSAPTLSRLENEKMPDVPTLYVVSKWLNKPMEHFFSTSKTK